MRERNNSPVFLIILILSVLLMIGGIIITAKKDTEAIQSVTQQKQVGENAAENVSNFLQDVNSNMQEDYDQLNEGLDSAL